MAFEPEERERIARRIDEIGMEMRALQKDFPTEAVELATLWEKLALLHDERTALEASLRADTLPDDPAQS